jgi:hypothetical protein
MIFVRLRHTLAHSPHSVMVVLSPASCARYCSPRRRDAGKEGVHMGAGRFAGMREILPQVFKSAKFD